MANSVLSLAHPSCWKECLLEGYEGEERALEPRVVASLMGCKLCGRDVGRNPLVAGSRNTLVIADVVPTYWEWEWTWSGV